jgi:hypothetical protein
VNIAILLLRCGNRDRVENPVTNRVLYLVRISVSASSLLLYGLL